MSTTMILLFQSILSGVLTGGVYALIGVGLTLVFGVMRVLNLAHGALVMVGAYVSWVLLAQLGWDPYLSIVAVAPLLFLWGALLQTAVVNRAVGALPQHQLLLTIGLGLVMASAVTAGFTSESRLLSTSYATSRLTLGGLSVSAPHLFSFGVAAAVVAALSLFLHRTETGQAMRATAQDRLAAQLMGIDVRRMSTLAFGLGAALAGVAGALLAPTSSISPQLGAAFTIRALVVVLLGGAGSVVGAILAGVFLGVTESVAATYVASGLAELVVYALFLVLLLVKPSGLLDKRRA